MRKATLYILMTAAFAALASAQTTDLPAMNFLADSVRNDGGVVQMNGNVRIAACSIVMADSAIWRDTQIELGGNARMQLTNGVDRLRIR
jgi:type 1 fimbria pilin